jgi:hypothetical protein
MKTVYFLLASVALMTLAGLPVASKNLRPSGPVDPKIAAALQTISPERIQADIEKLVSFQTRVTISAQDQKSGHGIAAARDWIKSEFERYSRDCNGCLEVKTDSFTAPAQARIPKPVTIVNVYAVLRGSDPESAKRIVLVTGHYDSRNSDDQDGQGLAPGANDDASGTAVSLECARVLSRLKFPATIIFLTVAGEEQGLVGSHHFAQMAKSEGWNIEAVLNNDIVGGDRSPGQDPSSVRVFSEGIPAAATEEEIRRIGNLGEESDSPSRELARYIADIGAIYHPGTAPRLIFRPDRYLRGGDHSSFTREGYAAVRLTEFRENYHHQHQNVRTSDGIEYGDVPKFVDFDYVARVSRLNAAVLASLAAAPGPPQKVRLLTHQLENDSTLQWEPPMGGLAAGYLILERATTSPEWEKAIPEGDVRQATIPESKDNVGFALCSVDKNGHRSLPVVPLPER